MKTIWFIVVSILIGIIIYLWFFRKPEQIVVPETVYHTDTIYVDKPYPVPKPYPVSVPPKTEYIYLKDQKAIDSLTLLLTEKDIVIQGLSSQIIISQDFLKQHPFNPKLIELNLSIDTLSLSTLNLNGIPSKEQFPIRLQNFNYRWTIEGLGKSPVKPPPAPKVPIGFYAGGGFNLLYTSPYLNFTVEKDIQRIRLYSDINVGLLKKEASSINLGAKYKLKK